MSLPLYLVLWLVITALLSVEFLLLNFHPETGLTVLIHEYTDWLNGLNLSPEPGRPISWGLGCVGFATMVLTNLYAFRKRLGFMRKWGNLSGWLSFHMFCGLLGPTLIIFHCNFRVRGLVAISFWSMIVAAVSGIIGRYFYIQILHHKSELDELAKYCEDYLEKERSKAATTVTPEVLAQLKEGALRWVGLPARNAGAIGLLGAFLMSFVGDIRLFLRLPKTVPGLPTKTRFAFRKYALSKRRLYFLEHFRQTMGYWHAFHLPFAVFMYVVAIVHIGVAILFGSGH